MHFSAALPFAAVCLFVGLGADYFVQTEQAGLTFGKLGAGDYLATYAKRLEAMQKEDGEEEVTAEALREAPFNSYLPEAPEGWKRTRWSNGAHLILNGKPRRLTEDQKQIIAEIADHPIADMLLPAEQSTVDEREKRDIWVYRRDDALIAIDVRLDGAPENGEASQKTLALGAIGASEDHAAAPQIAKALAVLEIASQTEGAAFALIKGVTYRDHKLIDLFDDKTSDKRPDTQRLIGSFGGGVTVYVSARHADAQQIVSLLEQLDYDSLNKMQYTQVAGIGTGETELASAASAQKEAEKQPATRIAGEAITEGVLITREADEQSDEASLTIKRVSTSGNNFLDKGNCVQVGSIKRCTLGAD